MNQNTTVRLYADVVFGYSRGILRGIADYAKIHEGWDFNFESTIEDGFTSTFAEEGVGGVIIQIRRRPHAEELIAAGVPAVNVANVLDPSAVLPSVFPDDAATGRMAAAYFLERGFRNFAYFAFTRQRYAKLRAEGFIAAIEEAGLRCPIFPKSIASGSDRSEEADREERLAGLRSLPRPLAIFCANDSSAKETVKECVKLGVQVPDEIAVLGVDNDEINCELSGVQLSSVRLATEQIGYEAAALLARLMGGQAPPTEPILVPPVEVITRRSTDVLSLGDVEVSAAVRFIRDRGGREINVQDLLERTSLSRRSLEMRFRKALGRSPYQEIRRVQIERAKLLLTGTDRPVREIADACGFKEPRQLSTAFHERIGLTPRQYRRRSRRSQKISDAPATEPSSESEAAV